MSQKKTKFPPHLQLRHNTWWIYYRLPKRLNTHPKFENAPAIFAQSLKTHSVAEAKRLRDAIIYNLNADVDGDLFETWKQTIKARNDEFAKANPHLVGELTYSDLLIDSIVNDASKKFGVDPETGHPLQLTEDQQLIIDAINNRPPSKHKRLKFITARLLEEYKANKKADKTIFKIRRSADWFLSHIVQDDIDLEL
ncbi:MAG: hypothetical protein ACU84H_02895, partial [Gammaproteobacteria bacterium]